MQALKFRLGDDGILVAAMDLPGRSTNVVCEALLRGIADPHPAMQAAWEALLDGALAGWDRFARLEKVGALAWRVLLPRVSPGEPCPRRPPP